MAQVAAYTKGSVYLSLPPCEEYEDAYWCDHCGPEDVHRVYKWQGQKQVAFLPHSCDEWIIGGADEVRALIADLQAALIVMESND